MNVCIQRRSELNSTDDCDEENYCVLSYSLGEYLDVWDFNHQIEDDIKRQISEHYSMPASSVTSRQMFNIKISPNMKPTEPTMTVTTT